MSIIADLIKRRISRRTFIKATGFAAAASVLPGPARTVVGGTPGGLIIPPGVRDYNTRLVLLGTTGGVSWWPGTNRASTSSALVVGDAVYVVDLGQGTTNRLAQTFNWGKWIDTPGGRIEDGSSIFLQAVKALFFTHLHQDHTADYPNLLLIGPGAGLGSYTDPVTNERSRVPLKVFGPCNRGKLEEDKSEYLQRNGTIIPTITYEPYSSTQTPGTREMTELIWQAYAQTINDMTLDNGYPDFTSLIDVKEIGPYDNEILVPMPEGWSDPNAEPCPHITPFVVYSDDKVEVKATLVNHHQVFPAFAFRFDTNDGSVVISGDTGRDTSWNLQELAAGADILVHEVIDPAWIEQKFGPKPEPPMDALKEHMYASHTTIADAGVVARECGVRTLVLNHIVPGNTPRAHLMQAKRRFYGKLIIGEDLMQIGVGSKRSI